MSTGEEEIERLTEPHDGGERLSERSAGEERAEEAAMGEKFLEEEEASIQKILSFASRLLLLVCDLRSDTSRARKLSRFLYTCVSTKWYQTCIHITFFETFVFVYKSPISFFLDLS